MRVNQAACQAKQSGFTLVELAIVLVIIGLILGMAFKGKDLIDGAKVKSAQANINKIQAGMNIYFERYGSYPGDGCPAAATVPTCKAGVHNGAIAGANEIAGFWTVLTAAPPAGTNILPLAERTNPFGSVWTVAAGTVATNTATTNNYLVATALGNAAVDGRYVCAMDQKFDDGVPNTGTIRSNGGTIYTALTDCWAITTGAQSLSAQILP
jgi:prepilin-type N-terminal cleavage/methylation domain-containing protein